MASVDCKGESSKLFECVQQRNIDEVKCILRENAVKVNCYDEHGMTPLQHAAYKGDKDMCEILLDHGAEVNSNRHEHKYTTLMFAALSGSVATTTLLLQAGASVNAVNSVGRTAAQMAAFVGNHACVSIINTFIPRENIDYYTKPQGLETEAKLPSSLAGLVHRFVTRTNVHPVGTALFIQKHPLLLENNTKIFKVLQLLSDKEMKQTETNEVLGLKFHFMAYVLEFCSKKTNDENDKDKTMTNIIKFWCKGRAEDGFAENLELFIRQGIRQFPYPESSILQQLVRSLAPVKIGEDPTALAQLSASINGQRMALNENVCTTCGEMDSKIRKCTSCKVERYCSQQCQKLHWFVHKHMCSELGKKREEAEANQDEP